MAKTLKEANIAGRADRKRLEASATPYWRGIDPDVHLGYRKGKRGGMWLVRWRVGAGYRQQKLGTADDELRQGNLSFDAAVRLARQRVEEERRDARALADGPPITVGLVVETYMAARDARHSSRMGVEARSDARSRLELHLAGRPARGKRKGVEAAPLASVPLHQLDESHLSAWRAALPDSLKSETKKRLVNDLRAALNEGYAANRNRLPASLPSTIKYGFRDSAENNSCDGSAARENQILSDSAVSSLIRAAAEIDYEGGWEGDLYRLVVVLAATGARFSQVNRMRVSDVQVEQKRLLIPASRKGKGAKNAVSPFAVAADIIDALMPAVEGRPGRARLLERSRSRRVAGGIRWERVGRGDWKTASELDRPWDLIRQRAGLPTVIPYALRHSSVVRGLRANLPIRMVAAMHDTSVVMIERHYGRYIADGLDELAARAAVSLVEASR